MKKLLYLVILFFCLIQTGICAVKLPKLISNGMVLQRDTKIKVWGWANPQEKVAVTFNKKTYSTITKPDGNWMITLPAMMAGGPYVMQIDATNHITLTDILLGDVWVGSGQSNMETTMARVKVKYEQEVAQANYPNIRQFNVPMTYNFNKPQADFISGTWVSASPETIANFSAVGYFFAKELYLKYKVPIGIIKSAVGGSPAEAWLSEKALKNYPQYLAITNKYKDSLVVDSIKKADAAVGNNWNKNIDENDLGFNSELKWFNSTHNASDWKSFRIPGFWDEDAAFKSVNESSLVFKPGNTNGVIWFRKEVEVPKSMIGKPAKLILGVIVDRDVVYVNGQFAGTTGYQYPPRRYELPSGLLKEGKNIIVVRVISNVGKGGFVKEKEYSLKTDNEAIDLKGDWQYKIGYVSAPMRGGGTTFQYQPAGLFNGMIAPLLNYQVKGVIWYQGESNTGRASEYKNLFSNVITDWREHWKQGTFPFLFVQLPNFMEAKKDPTESNWADLRNAQLKTLAVPNTAMAVAIDIGEWNDIHPLNKKDVGHRLAHAAQRLAYGDKKVVYSGPTVQSSKFVGNKVVITFNNTGSGLVAKNGDLQEFAIAGTDKKFVWAKAKIIGNKIEVWSDSIGNPAFVRYSWADNPSKANLYNKEKLPASPFEVGVSGQQ